MGVGRLILHEILYRKVNFALALAAATVAVAAALAVLARMDRYQAHTEHLLARHDQETQRLLEQQRGQVAERTRLLEDDVRKITKGLGFNILILPEKQNLADLYTQGYAAETMPEEYATRLAAAKDIVTIEHLLPALEVRTTWPEYKDRTIALVGIRGQVPFVQRVAEKKPLMDPVLPGQMVLGYELHHQLGIRQGQEVRFRGRTFTVVKLYPQRGTRDDVTAWISLDAAQAMFDRPGLINAIWALNCNCETIDRLAEVRAEVQRILPQTQVIEMASSATARAEARKRAQREAVEALAKAESDRAALGSKLAADRRQWRQQAEMLAAVLVPLAVVGAGVWIGLLAHSNVRERRGEIGILRALGLRGSQLLTVFLGKAALIGLVGALAGGVLGLALAGVWAHLAGDAASLRPTGRDALALALAVIAAPLLCLLATWLPASAAAGEDPATVLSGD